MLTEADVAAEAVTWLEGQGLEVFHEVELGGRRADIVAVSQHRSCLWVVESKLTLSFDLLEQAQHWKPYADAVSVIVPAAKPSPGRDLAYRVTRQFLSLGLLEVGDGPGVKVVREAPVLSRMDDELLHALRPEHKTFAKAGSPGGSGHFTAFGGTEKALAEYVAADPQCKLSDAVRGIKHHYRNDEIAEKSLEKAIKKGLVAGVKWMGFKGRIEPTEERTA